MAPAKRDVASRKLLLSRVRETFELSQKVEDDQSLRRLFVIQSQNIECTYEEFNKVHLDVTSQTAEAELEVLDNERKVLDGQYFEILKIREEVAPPKTATATPSSDSGFGSSNNHRLPKLELKSFNGDYAQWQTFLDLFTSLVHDQPRLTDIERFQYLLVSLVGEPLTLLKSIPLTAANYNLAFRTLKDRYSNKRLVATHHWRAIKEHAPIRNENAKELRCLIDTFAENLSILENLGLDVQSWDFILVDMLLEKLDASTRKRFELQANATTIPKFKDLKAFLSNQCIALETLATAQPAKSAKYPRHAGGFQTKPTAKYSSTFPGSPVKSFVANVDRSASTSQQQSKCSLCEEAHTLRKCTTFLASSPKQRYVIAKKFRRCFNCLGSHPVNNCSSTGSCRECGMRHHTLLHFPQLSTPSLPAGSAPNAPVTPPVPSSSTINSCSGIVPTVTNNNQVLLSTLCFRIRDKFGELVPVRALCDSGSQASFVSEQCFKRLGLGRSAKAVPILGLGQSPLNAPLGTMTASIFPFTSEAPLLTAQFLILPSICSDLPSFPVSSALNQFSNLTLADPNWNIPGPIDVLLGADIYASVVTEGVLSGRNGSPTAINTLFGWLLVGPVGQHSSVPIQSFFVSAEPTLQESLKAFWEIEEVPRSATSSPEDQNVEQLFLDTYRRTLTGRFEVTLPFKVNRPCFEKSEKIADKRLLGLERRFSTQPEVKEMYLAFMQDYLDAGHMTPLSTPLVGSDTYYIPHHCVFKMDGNSPKIRVVFDASAKAANQISLNDTLHVGPKLQSDISQILFKFRLHPFVFTCDVRQMYRQIMINPNQCRYQLIRWRFAESDPIQTFQLNTVTYGVSSSPYLAIRCLLQLAEEGRTMFPLATKAIEQGLYVDDIGYGSETLDEALETQAQLISLLKSGCFELRKWASNHPALLANIPMEHRQLQDVQFDHMSESTVKVLGLQWHSHSDYFTFEVKETNPLCSKRSLLSEVARLYDPLGFLSPVTCFAKILIQKLWTLGLDWDDAPPTEISAQWEKYKSTFHLLSSLKIPRCVRFPHGISYQLHAFCDASEAAYACVIYIRAVLEDGLTTVRLWTAKSKVAPVKRVSIPRLELLAAALLAKLVSFVVNSCKPTMLFEEIFAWCDSTVALAWIRSSPHRWKTFVANRVAFIQDRLPINAWRHVRSQDNPADLASRSCFPDTLSTHRQWWEGPTWLASSSDSWPVEPIRSLPSPDTHMEERTVSLLAQVPTLDWANQLLDRFSSLRKVQGIIASCQRFIYNCRNPNKKATGYLNEQELHQALLFLVKCVQKSSFTDEIPKIRDGSKCPKYLQKLSPFLDTEGYLRVGGRLSHSDLPFSSKHPLLLPGRHRLTFLLINQVHNRHCHPGINQTLHLLQQNFYILPGRPTVKRALSQCIRCFRARPTTLEPPMGQMPHHRVSQLKPFSCVGIDFCGPFKVIPFRRRGVKTLKAYLCVFVCFATKAIHIEVASDLSSDTFLAALRRFISRRGRCSYIYSDNGTNFIGANRELTRAMKSAAECEAISWHFNPPSAPHMGGLWESAVKSLKTHLTRVIGVQILTQEELATLVTQVEALLNSRPLCEVSSDPNDLNVLTPGHFLTLELLSAPPDPDLTHLNLSTLSRWQLIQNLHQSFWRRWKNEYLHNFFQKSKWSKTLQFEPVDVGTLVIIKDDLAPPLRWKIGKIIELHLGVDGIARVATVRTSQGMLKRPLVKLCPLPK